MLCKTLWDPWNRTGCWSRSHFTPEERGLNCPRSPTKGFSLVELEPGWVRRVGLAWLVPVVLSFH